MADTKDAVKQKILSTMNMHKALQFLLLGLLWLIFVIPLLTAGAATCSVYYVGVKILNDDKDIKVAKLFFKGLKENFVQGLLMSLVSVLTLGGSGALTAWAVLSEQGLVFILIGAGLAFVSLIVNAYAYPIIGRYKNTFGNILKNSIALIFTYLQDAIRLTFILAFLIIIDVILFRLNLIAGIVSLLFWPSVIFYFISFFLTSIFYKIEHPVKYDN